MMSQPIHQPVLLEEVLKYLQPEAGQTYLDLTAGYGGHAQKVAAKIGQQRLILVDRDEQATSYLRQQFSQARILHKNFADASKQLVAEAAKVDMILMDLGVSSAQLNNPERGFSFKSQGPLDMRMDQSAELNAADIVNSYSEKELADILYNFGGERRSRQIAKVIVNRRPFTNTLQLAEAVASRFRSYQRIHPATRTFQAIRIVVNDELKQLEDSLPLVSQLLNPRGRLVIISFHSLEDRLAKHYLKGDESLRLLEKKVIKGKNNDSNPRARSAKMRAAVKTKK